MGKAGAKLTGKATGASTELVESLGSLGAITARKMFGGYGIFESGAMFALVSSDGGIYFKVSDANMRRFDDAGSERFGRMPYASVPDRVLDDHPSLIEWAASSIAVARAAKGL